MTLTALLMIGVTQADRQIRLHSMMSDDVEFAITPKRAPIGTLEVMATPCACATEAVMPYQVMCAVCRYEAPSDTDAGGVRCTLVGHNFCASLAEAMALLNEMMSAHHDPRGPIWSRAVAKRMRVEVPDDAHVEQFLREVSEDLHIQRFFANVRESWIDGTHPDQVTLAQARAYPGADAVAMLSWEYYKYIYVLCPVALIHCDEAVLRQLLADVNVAARRRPRANKAHLSFFRAPLGHKAGRGKWGAVFSDDVWIHPLLREKGLEPAIRAVLAGERPTIG